MESVKHHSNINQDNNQSLLRGFLIASPHERDRLAWVESTCKELPGIQVMPAIYPSKTHIPFFTQLQEKTKQRTGYALQAGEIGVLLSNREIWRQIVQSPASEQEAFLILESDSELKNPTLLKKYFHQLTAQYDLFFFGSWLGNTKLFRSSRKPLEQGFVYGTPFIKTISGGYGYALNKKAARHLLETTNQIAHPVDEFKRYITPGYLKIGAVVPELISVYPGYSTIGERPHAPAKEKFKMLLLNIRNSIISFCK